MAELDKIGFALHADPREGRSWVALAQRAESVGFEAICVPDHPGSTGSPFVALAALAQTTSSIMLGTSVLNLGTWPPLSLASEVATLHSLSDGRVQLGVGAGHTSTEWTATGQPYPPASRRIEHMIAVTDATQALLRGEQVTACADVFRLDRARMSWLKGSSISVPLLVGGNALGVLRYGARAADTVELTGLGRTMPDGHLHVPQWDPSAVDLRTAVIAAERCPRPVRLSALVHRVAVTNHRLEMLASFRDELAGLLGDELAPTLPAMNETPFLLVGTEDEIVRQLHANRERWGISRYTVRTEAIDPITTIIEQLTTDP